MPPSFHALSCIALALIFAIASLIDYAYCCLAAIEGCFRYIVLRHATYADTPLTHAAIFATVAIITLLILLIADAADGWPATLLVIEGH